jgi:membrane fusion protein, copper/silver efflux system
MRKAVAAISLLLAVLLGFFLGHLQRQANASNGRRVLYYVDPMHPDYKSDKPGIAPDCGMQLEPVYADQAGTPIAAVSAKTPPGTVRIDPYRQRLFGIRVATVEKTSGTRAFRIPGKVTADETRVYRITAGVDGFVKETHEDAAGSQVKKDQRLAVIYSPEFLNAIGSYLAVYDPTQAGGAKQGAAGAQSPPLAQTWANRLRLLGIGDAQIRELDLTRKVPEDIYVVSPADGFILERGISAGERFEKRMEFYRIADLSRVWIIADLFENESQGFHPRGIARITLPDQKTSFSARVSDVLPEIDPGTRALKLRLEAKNRNFSLRPGMFVDVDLTVQIPPGLSVPGDAVLDSGLSKHVFLERGNGIFEARQVETGEQFGDRVQILRGLAEGDRVVASGTFLLDSESRMHSSTFLPSVPPASDANPPQ